MELPDPMLSARLQFAANISFQFGTNWPGFMAQAGNVAAPPARL